MRSWLVALMLVMVAVAPAWAQESDEPAPAPEGAMLLILDASGSMNRTDTDGVAFIDKAKDAVTELVEALPDGLNVGLRVYGHREPNTDPEIGCRDTELVAPVGPLDRTSIKEALADVTASGFTPIGLSLEQAVADLPDDGPRAIVLISDGEDTCAPPDPCEVAETLFGDRIDARIETVGFLVGTGSAAEQQLRCIANATGGQYQAVDRASDLANRLEGITEEFVEWQPITGFNGALRSADAPSIPLTPKADWRTDEPGKIAVEGFRTQIMPGETRWYRLDLWELEGAWLWANLVRAPGVEIEGHLEMLVLNAEGERVEKNALDRPLRAEVEGEDVFVGAAIESHQGLTGQASYTVGVRWDAPSALLLAAVDLGVDILISNNDDFPIGSRTEVVGSLVPDDAPVLALEPLAENGSNWRGGKFRGPLAAGETRWYRVDHERIDELTTFALFPADRFVGEGTSGEFSIALTDLDGNAVGGAFDEWPQLRQLFGDERVQATVSASTSVDPEPHTGPLFLGFSWDGPSPQESEVRFEVEMSLGSEQAELADETAEPQESKDDSVDEPPTGSADQTEDSVGAVDTPDGGGGAAVWLPVALAAVLIAAIVGLIARARRGRS